METRILIPSGLKIVTQEVKFRRKCSSKPTLKSVKTIIGAEDEKPSSSSGHCETSDPERRPRSSSTSSAISHSSGDDNDEYNFKSGYNSSSSASSLLESSSDNIGEFSDCSKLCKLENAIGSSEASSKVNRSKRKSKVQIQSRVTVCASRVIEKGTVFLASEGDVHIVNLKGIPAIAKDDIRLIFGCFEKITTSPQSPLRADPLVSSAVDTHSENVNRSNNNNIRLCNWVRFLRCGYSMKAATTDRPSHFSSNSDSEDNIEDNLTRGGGVADTDSANIANESQKSDLNRGGPYNKGNNIIAHFTDGRPVFEVIARLVPGTELLAYFDMDSITQSSPFMMMMSMPKTIPNVSSSPQPPYMYHQPSAALISSSFGIQNNNGFVSGDSDQKGHQQLRPLSLYPYYAFHNFDNKQTNSFRLFGGSKIGIMETLDYDKRGGGGGDKEMGMIIDCNKERGHRKTSSLTDAPLDLSKLPTINRSATATQPLKIGTPFDSPESNEDDGKESISKREKSDVSSSLRTSKSGSSSLFSIRNVLRQSSPPSKLFQPYSLECENDTGRNRNANQRSLTSPDHPINTSTALATPPSIGSSSNSPVVRNSPVLRPILRTRGRERSLLPCEVCGKAFDRPSLLKRHLRTHTGEKPHICDVCSKGFSTSSSLNTHRRIHSGEKPHQCPICGKRFTASSNLYYHRMTHNKEKPHKCMLCGKSFPTPGDLKSHQYVHSGSWPYTCPVCHRGFSKQTNLRNHLLLHSGMSSSSSKPGDKPHTCQICDKKFALACNLRAHLRTHEEDPISSCSVCKRTFLSSMNMLVNGRCRGCLLNMTSNNSGSSNVGMRREASPSSIINSGDTVKGSMSTMESSMLSHRLPPGSIPSLTQLPGNAMQIGSLAMAQIPGFPMPIPGSLPLPGSLHFPSGTPTSQSATNAATAAAAAAAASLFRNTGGTTNATLPTNSSSSQFLEQLFEWNYRFAKETAGNLSLSIMQQKLLESQVLAAQLMTASANANAPGFSVQDILRLRPPEFPQLDAANENKYIPR